MLGGKVDGITNENTLVEVKNRQYRLFSEIPIYEKIQIHTYMYLTGIKQCHYVQCYKDKSNTELLNYDEDFYQDVLHNLTKFVEMVSRLTKSENLQDTLLLQGILPKDTEKEEKEEEDNGIDIM